MKIPALWVVGGLLLLRIAFLGVADLYPEEAYYWNYAKHLDLGYLDHPPMVAWMIHLGTFVFGDGEIGVRVFAVISALITSVFIGRLTALLFGRSFSETAILLAHLLPFFFMIGFMMTPDAPLTAFWSGALYFLARALLDGRAVAWLGLGVCLGLGMLSKYTIALLGPATLLFIVLDPSSRRWFRHPAPYLAVALALVIFSPVIFWNFQHHWASFAFQSADRLAEQNRFSTHELLAAILVVLSPVGALIATRQLWSRGDETAEARRRQLFIRVYTLVPLAVPLVFSVTHRVKLNWTGPIWLAVLPAMAVALVAQRPDWLRRAWQLNAAAMIAVYIAFFAYLTKGLLGLPYSSEIAVLPVGWSELGRELERKRSSLPAGALLVGMDRNFIASEAAFYHSRPLEAVLETTGSHLFGGKALMYKYWFPVAGLEGRTLLLVSFNRGDLNRSVVRKRTAQLEEVEEHWLERGGRRICAYYTRVAHGYRSPGGNN